MAADVQHERPVTATRSATRGGGGGGGGAPALPSRPHDNAAPDYADRLAAARQEDYADIEKHDIVSHVGSDAVGRPVIMFAACNLPGRHHIDMDKLTRYLMVTLDGVVESDYVILYLHAGLHAPPGIAWIHSVYRRFDRKYKKNLKNLYIVHPTRTIRHARELARVGLPLPLAPARG